MDAPAWLVRWLARVAEFVRAFAALLERAAGGPTASPAAMQALTARFPGAPDHWLQVIAERAPHLAEAPPSEPVLPRGPPPPPLQPMAAGRRSQPSRRWNAEDALPRGPDARETPAEPPRNERRVGAVFRALSRRRRPALGFSEPRRRAPGWSATFESATHAPAEPATFDTAPTIPRRTTAEMRATPPSARLPADWKGPLGLRSQRTRWAGSLPSPSMGEGRRARALLATAPRAIVERQHSLLPDT